VPARRRPRSLTIAHARGRPPTSISNLRAGTLSFLEEAVVTDATREQYRSHVARLVVWCQLLRLDWSTEAELDALLTGFLVQLCLDGYSTATGRFTVAGLRYFLPHLASKGTLVRAGRAITGWAKLVPPQMRMPLPRPAMMAMVGLLVAEGRTLMALFILLSFLAYLRPTEALRLTTASFIPPAAAAGASYSAWGLIVNNADCGIPGKTGVMDESVMLDQPEFWPLWEALKAAKPPAAPIWNFTGPDVSARFKQAMAQIGLGDESATLYTLRHGGASDDLLAGRRSRQETMDRGRWVTEASLRRYGKRTRLQERLNRLPPPVLQFGLAVEARVVELFDRAGRGLVFPLPLPPLLTPPAHKRKADPPRISTKWVGF